MEFSERTEPQACREWTTFRCGTFVFCGYSRSADKTFFFCKQLDLALDAGCCYGHQMKVVLLTHGHSDHTRDLGYLAAKEPVFVCCPREIEEYVRRFVVAEFELGTAMPIERLRQNFTITGVVDGSSFRLEHLKQDMVVEVFAMSHAVPCVGYGVVPRKKKLKEQFVGKNGKELGQLRKDGVEFEELVTDYASGFVYFGDTGIEAVIGNAKLLRYGHWIIECTFLRPIPDELTDEEIVARCKRDGHIYWPQLEPLVRQHPEIHFVLIHFSLRYSKEDIVDFFKPMAFTNVTVVACKYSTQ
jgi:ribonuclease Z